MRIRVLMRHFDKSEPGIFKSHVIMLVIPLQQSCYNRSVSELLEQPCDKFDIPIKQVISCQQVIDLSFTSCQAHIYLLSEG